MTKLIVSMTEFMEKYGPHLGFPPGRVEEMAYEELKEGNDLQFFVRMEHITIPIISIQEYKYAREAPSVKLTMLKSDKSPAPAPAKSDKSPAAVLI